MKNNAIVFSLLYGIGTALPVIVFAFTLAVTAHRLGAVFNKLTVIKKWIRTVTSIAMLSIGIYLVLRHNFGLNF